MATKICAVPATKSARGRPPDLHSRGHEIRAVGVDRDWLYRRIKWGSIPAERHPTTGHYLIAAETTSRSAW